MSEMTPYGRIKILKQDTEYFEYELWQIEKNIKKASKKRKRILEEAIAANRAKIRQIRKEQKTKKGKVEMPDQETQTAFFEIREVGKNPKKRAKVIIQPMNQEQARKVYPYRPHNKYSESRFGGDTLVDDVALLLNGLAARCCMCQAPTKIEYLKDQACPDCDGRSECNGTDPHVRTR